MFKAGDIVRFAEGFLCKSGEVLLVGDDILLVRIERGQGHCGLVAWTESLGWQSDETYSCLFVGKRSATVVKSKPSFKGNTK